MAGLEVREEFDKGSLNKIKEHVSTRTLDKIESHDILKLIRGVHNNIDFGEEFLCNNLSFTKRENNKYDIHLVTHTVYDFNSFNSELHKDIKPISLSLDRASVLELLAFLLEKKDLI